MATATERIPVLVTAAEKGQIALMAKSAGLSMGEFLRRAAASFNPAEDDKLLEGMMEQMKKPRNMPMHLLMTHWLLSRHQTCGLQRSNLRGR